MAVGVCRQCDKTMHDDVHVLLMACKYPLSSGWFSIDLDVLQLLTCTVARRGQKLLEQRKDTRKRIGHDPRTPKVSPQGRLHA